MKYYLVTYGCQMNKADSERIAAHLEKKGYKSTSRPIGADLIVVNMCSVRQSAVDRVYGKIRDFAKLKVKNEKLKVVLTGCILKKDKEKLAESFDSISNFRTLNLQPKYQNNCRAFVPISQGCSNFCSYCVVPFVRGPLICRNHQKVLKEVKNAVKKGSREIWLLGQNVNDYTSPRDPSTDFPKLLKMVNAIPGNFQVRFMSPNPKNFSDELIEVMASSQKVAKYLHLPVQSGDDKILKAMKRPYTVKKYKELIWKIREKIPNISLSTDVIVGFPGETKKQFENTVKLFKEIKFNMAYIAKYSPRPGTAAFKLRDDVSHQEKERRLKILNDIIYARQKTNCHFGTDSFGKVRAGSEVS